MQVCVIFSLCRVQFSLKVLFCKVELDDTTQGDSSIVPTQEVSIKLSVLPIRLNIDQVGWLNLTCMY